MSTDDAIAYALFVLGIPLHLRTLERWDALPEEHRDLWRTKAGRFTEAAADYRKARQ